MPSALTVDSVGSPEGTITQTARGGESASTSASSVDTPGAGGTRARNRIRAAVVGDARYGRRVEAA